MSDTTATRSDEPRILFAVSLREALRAMGMAMTADSDFDETEPLYRLAPARAAVTFRLG